MKRIKELLNWTIKDVIKMLIGTLMFCIAINVFVVPNDLYTGGILGLSQLIRSIVIDLLKLNITFDFSGLIYYLINIPLFIIAYKNLSKSFFFRTIIVISIQTISQDVVTYFNGQSKIYSEGETASLYSVKLTSNYTFVTIELSPTEDRIRMNYFTSGFTHIKVGPYYKIRFLGALSNDGNSYHPCEPDDGWGWSKCKVGEKYRYTLVFDGRIPHGYTNFTMFDDYVP